MNKNYSNNKTRWQFAPLVNIEEANFNGALERFYKLGVSGLVRENIQNSLDGRLGEEGAAIVNINIGTIEKGNIPGMWEIEDRIKSLKGYNQYTKETIEHMQKSIDKDKIGYISFEDSNTKGLSGAKNGQSDSEKDTWGIYAYKKGVHSTESDDKKESERGGSHGIGKIASNAASDLFMMFFANCDENGDKHLGGTIQLLEHKYREKYYRSTGYFTNVEDSKYIPFKNEFSSEFEKNTRGLKIIIPFLKEEFNNEKEIIKSVCDSFFVAILKEKLVVNINGKSLDKETIGQYIKDKEYYEQQINEITREFTPLYLDTYLNVKPIEVEIKSKNDVYKFDLYLRIENEIRKGRLGIIRTVGMKIEDKVITGNATKPFNGVLIPKGTKEDAFLKLLENESHTKIESQHLKDAEKKRDAIRFISNITKVLSEKIGQEMKKLIETDGAIDTKDIIYTMEAKFKKDLEKINKKVILKSEDGEKKNLDKDTGSKSDKGDRTKEESPKDKEKRAKEKEKRKKEKKEKALKPRVKVDTDEGNEERTAKYKVSPDVVERIVLKNKEFVKIDLSQTKEAKKIKDCDLGIEIVDGMGKEYENEFTMEDNYSKVIDKETKEVCPIKDNKIKNIRVKKGIINIEIELKDKVNKALKFIYFVEV
ncbi:MAG: hypothetical protein ACRDAU_09010 [Clostridium sp.]